MGNTCGCCADDAQKKDNALDSYLKKHHKNSDKMTKFDKKDYWLT